MSTITRIFTFDSGHRVMNEKMKCFNLHGHTYKVEATWQYDDIEDIGYAIDFKEIKRVFGEFIEDYIDHAFIANPMDTIYIDACKNSGSKIWLMSLNGVEYCNPTAENISKELFMIGDLLINHSEMGLSMFEIKLWETPNAFVTVRRDGVNQTEKGLFHCYRYDLIADYRKKLGIINYDDRK
jgi:6-pyruvoyltetrahydropterin/6-carboxytetrahydropterin synthase